MSTDEKEMALRDRFAATALPLAIEYWRQLGADEEHPATFEWHHYVISEDCADAALLAYRMADAMMLARKDFGVPEDEPDPEAP